MPKNWAVLGILQRVQPVPRARDCLPALPSVAKAGGGRIQAEAEGAPNPHDRKLADHSDVSRYVHHNGYIYATAHAHKVKSRIRVQDNDGVYSGVVIGDGFEIAPGDASDIEVTNAYPWQCLELFFSDDQRANTALGLKTKQPLGHPSMCCQMNMRPGVKMLSPKEFDQKVIHFWLEEVYLSNNFNHRDILIRKRASPDPE